MAVYNAGDVILEAMPYAHGLNPSEKGERCDFCLEKRDMLSKCTGCGAMFYCTEECRENDWKVGHGFRECELYSTAHYKDTLRKHYLNQAKDSDYGDTLVLLKTILLRTVLRSKYDKSAGGKAKLFTESQQGQAYINENKMNPAKLSGNDQTGAHVARFVYLDIGILGLKDNVTKESIVLLFSRLSLKIFTIWHDLVNGQGVGKGLYLETGSYTHSCAPNTVASFEGPKIIVRGTKEINTANDSVTMALGISSHICATASRQARREKLKRLFFFDCACNRCKAHYDLDMNKVKVLETKSNKMPADVYLENLWKLIEMERDVLGQINYTVLAHLVEAHEIMKYCTRNTENIVEQLEEALNVIFGPERGAELMKQHEEEAKKVEIVQKVGNSYIMLNTSKRGSK